MDLNQKCEQQRDGRTGNGEFSVTCEFRRLLEDMAAFAKSKDIPVAPYEESRLPHFAKLPHRQQLSVYRGLKAYYESMLQTHSANPLNVRDSVELMLLKLECDYDRDYLGILTDRHVVEIYSVEQLQAFRNIHFFTLTHYSLEEICTRPWFELWERDGRITELLLDLVRRLADYEITGTISVLMPTHEVRDQAARLKTGQLMGPMSLAPLYDKSGAVYGYITSYVINPVP